MSSVNLQDHVLENLRLKWLADAANATANAIAAITSLVKEFSNGLSSLLGSINILGVGMGSISSILGASRRVACIDTGSALNWIQIS